MNRFFFLLAISFISMSCNKNDAGNSNDSVEIYLLKTVQLVTNKCEVDASASAIENLPLITNRDIAEYSKSDYEFKLSAQAMQKIKGLSDKTAFAVTVNKEVIYYGFYKPGISSSSCDNSITMDVSWSSVDRIRLQLGYPGQLQGVSIDDKRNAPKLLAALSSQNKLR